MKTIRTQADSVGTQLARTMGELVSRVGGAQLGPKLLSERFDMTVGTASRFLRAIAESNPMDVMQDIPGPTPLKKFIESTRVKGASDEQIMEAAEAVEEFEELIRQYGGSRSSLNALLSNWQPRGRKQFALKRRQEAFKALSELNGISSSLTFGTFCLFPNEEKGFLDMLHISGMLEIKRTRSNATVYVGSRRDVKEGESVPPHLHPLTLDGESALGAFHSVRVDEFGAGLPAPVETSQVGDSIIHSLGDTGLSPGDKFDFITAELTRPGARRRGPGFCEDPLFVFHIPAAPCRKLSLDLLIHRDALPPGSAELLVYSTIPLGPAVVGDPARKHDLTDIPETLEIRTGSLDSLQYREFPRYVDLLENSFERLGWDMGSFTCWRLQVDFAPVGTQFCIRFA
ncbi:MAG: hypothetical protein GY930_06735 [bacterium]|nr:hypothetical protein [bacterium]